MLTYIIMPIIKNKIILAVTKLFKIEQLEVEFNNNQNRTIKSSNVNHW